MHRWFLTLAALALLVVAFAPDGLAERVHVRVEGKTRTIFGSTQPAVEVGGTSVPENPVPPQTALGALEAAGGLGEFYYHVAQTGFGPYVDQIGRYAAGGTSGWVFKVNGASPPVGADQVTLRDGDSVLWYWADFSSGAGPMTLRLTRSRGSCYRAFAEDDSGNRISASSAVLHVGSRRAVQTRGGSACVGRHRGLLVRATMPGAVRSNAVR